MTQHGEEAAELLATMKGDHVAMKQWYNHSGHVTTHDVRSKYGTEYPMFWRDVINWPGWKESRKAYLKFLESGSGQDNTQSSSSRTGGDSAANVSMSNNNNQSESGAAAAAESHSRKKRRSRWSSSGNDDDPSSSSSSKPRRSRWSAEDKSASTTSLDGGGGGNITTNLNISAAVSAAMSMNPMASVGGGSNGSTNPAAAASKGVLDLLPGLPATLTEEQQQRLAHLQYRLRVANDKLSNLDQEAARVDSLPRGHRERSPSPPPVYGPDGKRKNTRAVRWRERYTNERLECLEQIMELNSAFKVAGFQKRKRTKKIFIPVEEHPTYNFIGLIIGPRGKTQKEMEASTGCKIAIRGKGSIKEGSRGRKDGKLMEGDDEPLHVVITGDEQSNVDQAARLINDMLVVIDDDKNVHKQNQLRELALLNGTLKEDDFCPICAERGHRQFECPKRLAQRSKTASVISGLKCEICGDTSHPTRDCVQQKNSTETQASTKEMDSDYLAFMSELDSRGKPPPPSSSNGVTSIAPPTESKIVSNTATTAVPVPAGAAPPAAPVPPPPHLAQHSTGSRPSNTTIVPQTDLPPPVPLPPPPPQPPTGGAMPQPPPYQLPPPPPSAAANNAALPVQFVPAGASQGGGGSFPGAYGLPPPPGHQLPPPPPPVGVGNAMPPYGGGYDAGQYQQQQQPSHHPHAAVGGTAGRKKGRRGKRNDMEDETLQGWNPQQFYQQGGEVNSAGGFNWWENK